MIDTHTHLYLPEFASDGGGEAAVVRAIAAGVDRMIFPNVDRSSVEPMQSLAAKFPGHISMAMGLHPTEVKENWQEELDFHLDLLDDGGYVAVGEVGIDLYWDKTFESEQMKAFDIQVSKASALGLPVIIHCRDGLEQALEVLSGHPGVPAVFHSFGGNADDVNRIRRVGDYYFGINGIVTFKNCKVRDVLPEIGLDRLLLETDAPYLAPVPHRGKRNESAFLTDTAKHIANHLGISYEALDVATTQNAKNFFKI